MKWFLLVALIAVCLEQGLTQDDDFKCYDCLGTPDIKEGCITDPFNPSGAGVSKADNCTSKQCGKATAQLPGTGTVVGRFCDDKFDECSNDDIDTCREKDLQFFGKTLKANLCCCSSDLCNGANPTSAVFASTLALVILPIVI